MVDTDRWNQHDAPPGCPKPHRVGGLIPRQAAIEHLHSVLAVPATRTERGIPTEASLDEGDGMTEPCALSLDNALRMPKAYFVERICWLGIAKMSEACRALHIATGRSTPG